MRRRIPPERLYQLIQWLEEPVIQPERWQRDVLEALRELREWRLSSLSGVTET